MKIITKTGLRNWSTASPAHAQESARTRETRFGDSVKSCLEILIRVSFLRKSDSAHELWARLVIF